MFPHPFLSAAPRASRAAVFLLLILLALLAIPALASAQTTILSGPAALTKSSEASFHLASQEAVSGYECSLDEAEYASCSPPVSLSGLSEGPHRMSIRSLDAEGTPEASPASHEWTTDYTPPVLAFTATPPNPSNSSSAAFTWLNSDSDSTVMCALDGAAAVPCDSLTSHTLTGLSQGAHTLIVTATDPADNSASISYSWATDYIEPALAFTATPAAFTNSSGAAFSWSLDDGSATVSCRLDSGLWTACDSPTSHSVSGLSEGAHTLTVRAEDAAGNLSGLTHSWTTDYTAPTASFSSAPAALSNDATPDFAVTASEPTGAISCSLDSAAYAACPASHSLSSLADGAHTLSVRVEDRAANFTTISHSWTQDTLRPQTTLTAGPATSAPVNSTQARFEFSSPSADTTGFECRLDYAAWEACVSPHTLTGLANGDHVFEIRALDAAGNADGTPASRAWTVALDGAPLISLAVSAERYGLRLDASASVDPEGRPLRFRWTQDGRGASSEASLLVEPTRAGESHLRLTVTDESGQTSVREELLLTADQPQTAAHETVQVLRFSGLRPDSTAKRRLAWLKTLTGQASSIKVEGHAAPGSGGLAKQRAQWVAQQLGDKAQVSDQGTSRPVASNKTPQGRAANQRVVVTVTADAPAERLVCWLASRPELKLSNRPAAKLAAQGAAAPRMFAFLSRLKGRELTRLAEVGHRISVLAPNWYGLDERRASISGGAPDSKVMALSRKLGFAVWPTVNASMEGSRLIDTPAGRSKIVKSITRLAARYKLKGITLDMEGMEPDQRESFSALIRQLDAKLGSRKLAVYAVRRDADQVRNSAAAYDWALLAREADLLIASGYDEHGSVGEPGPTTSARGFEAMTAYAASVSRSKIAPAVAGFGWDYRRGGLAKLVEAGAMERQYPSLREVGSANGSSAEAGKLWFETAHDLWQREQTVRAQGFGWMALFSLGRESERYWERSSVR